MKLLFDCFRIFGSDFDCKLGLDWYGFKAVTGAKLPGSNGFSFIVYLIWWRASITWVKDHKAYEARMNYRSTDRFKVKK